MSRMPGVSVIIPAYNAAKTVERTVVSLFEQTWKDLEIIIVDDGSTDETQMICASLKQNGAAPVKILCQKNKRQSAARNAGIDMAEGDYVIFLDMEPGWIPGKKTFRLFPVLLGTSAE